MASLRVSWVLPILLLLPAAARAGDIGEDLIAAARKSDLAAVKALLDKGADVNAKNRYGATALSYAAERGSVEVVKLLIERGADVNVKDTFYGERPIGWALSKGHVEVVRLLLAKGAEGRDRVLLSAAREGKAELARAALEKKDGLKPETLSAALAAATRNKHDAVVELLKEAGAKPPTEVKVSAETLQSYAGVYRNERGSEMTFRVKDGKLMGGPPGQDLSLIAVDERTFRPDEFDGVTITFGREGEKVVGLTLKPASGEQVAYKRVEGK
jgi:ankyrin repeat protein